MRLSLSRGIKNVTIVGAGQMGAGIAQVAAVTGHSFVLNDISDQTLEKAKNGIEKSLKRISKKMEKDAAEKFMTHTLR